MSVQFQRYPFLRKPFYDPYNGWKKDLCRCSEEEKMIPKDECSSGNRDDECWAKVYGKTKAEVERKIRVYFDMYPVQGYSTTVDKRGYHEGYYYAFISRWHSCD